MFLQKRNTMGELMTHGRKNYQHHCWILLDIVGYHSISHFDNFAENDCRLRGALIGVLASAYKIEFCDDVLSESTPILASESRWTRLIAPNFCSAETPRRAPEKDVLINPRWTFRPFRAGRNLRWKQWKYCQGDTTMCTFPWLFDKMLLPTTNNTVNMRRLRVYLCEKEISMKFGLRLRLLMYCTKKYGSEISWFDRLFVQHRQNKVNCSACSTPRLSDDLRLETYWAVSSDTSKAIS